MKNIIFVIFFIIFNTFSLYSQYLWSTYIGGTGGEYAIDFALDEYNNVFLTGTVRSVDFPILTGSYQDRLKGNTDVFVTKLKSDGNNLIFSTYLGGTGYDDGFDISIDKLGNSYISGICWSGFPTTSGAFRQSNSNSLNFALKLNSSGSALIFSTCIGIVSYGSAIVIDTSNNTFVVSYTNSTNFPVTTGAYDTVYLGGDDIVLTKLNSLGSNIIFSTFIGGSNEEESFDICTDSLENSYIIGYTTSNDFPVTQNVFQASHKGKGDVFLTKFNSTGASLLYSTFIGGSSIDFGSSIVIDNKLNAYITGQTGQYSWNDFPVTMGCYDSIYNGGRDMFVTKINSSASDLIFSTYIGGSNNDAAGSLILDHYNNVYLLSSTYSKDFPLTIDAFDSVLKGLTDCLLVEIDSLGSKLLYSTYLGGSNSDGGGSILLDGLNDLYLVGGTNSNDFPVTSGSYDTSYNGGGDIFVTKINLCHGEAIFNTNDSIIFSKLLCESHIQDTSIIIHNTGSCILGLMGVDFSGLDSLEFSLTEPKYLPRYIQPSDSLKITIRFNPTEKTGSKLATLNISNNTLNNPYKINLSAYTDLPVIQSVNQITFPWMFCSKFIQDTTIMLSNKGTCGLTFADLSVFGADSSQFSILEPTKIPLSVQSGDSVKLIIRFTPNDTAGTKTATLNIENNTSINPYIINLTARNDSIAFNLENTESDTIIIDLGIICPGSGKDTTITIFNKSSIGTTLQIDNVDPDLQIIGVDKAEQKKEAVPLKVKKKKK